MSKIGKKNIPLPAGVEVKITGKHVDVKGPKGNLSYHLLDGVNAELKDGVIYVTVEGDHFKNLRGLTRTLIANMVNGVVQGFEKKMHMIGVGYNVKQQGTGLLFNLGLSHSVNFALPQGVSSKLEKNAKGEDLITISGIDKQLVGETAAKLKSLKWPESYKGKGIRYFGEVIKLKAGKTAKK